MKIVKLFSNDEKISPFFNILLCLLFITSKAVYKKKTKQNDGLIFSWLLTSLICLFFTLNLSAQQASSSQLTLTTVLDSIEKIMDKEHIPGLLLTMATKDTILYDGL